MIVYVITSGKYSDYGIDAVTLNKEEANKMIELFPDERIEEYDTDNFPRIITNDPYWHCEYNLQTDIDRESIVIYREDHYSHSDFKILNKVYNKTYLGKNYGFATFIQAKDRDHAAKIFYDKVAEWKAEQKGIV